MIRRLNFFGNPNVGVYSIVTDKFAIVPRKLPKTAQKSIEKFLEVPVIATDIGQSRLIGVLGTGNSNGLCVPVFIMEGELTYLRKELQIRIESIPTDLTALGNNILCNDKVALLNPEFDEKTRKQISEVLGVEVIARKIAVWQTVGSAAVVTNKGILLPPNCKKEEIIQLQEEFGVPASIGTINSGVPLVGSGLRANSKGAIAGLPTTGPELARVGTALEL
jgi:translation initiation factor 6